MADLGAIGGGVITTYSGGGAASGGVSVMAAITLSLTGPSGLAVPINPAAASVFQTFTWIPSNGIEVDTTPRVIKAQFGDGYAQRATDGINNQPETWEVRFEYIAQAEHDAIKAFLEEHGATTPFKWTTPDGVEKQFVCESWRRTMVYYGVRGISANFVEDFTP